MNLLVKSVAEWHNNADEQFPQALDSNLKSAAAQIAYYGADPHAASDPTDGHRLQPVAAISMTMASWTPRPGVMRAAIGRLASAGDRRLDFDGDGKITLTDFSKGRMFRGVSTLTGEITII